MGSTVERLDARYVTVVFGLPPADADWTMAPAEPGKHCRRQRGKHPPRSSWYSARALPPAWKNCAPCGPAAVRPPHWPAPFSLRSERLRRLRRVVLSIPSGVLAGPCPHSPARSAPSPWRCGGAGWRAEASGDVSSAPRASVQPQSTPVEVRDRLDDVVDRPTTALGAGSALVSCTGHEVLPPTTARAARSAWSRGADQHLRRDHLRRSQPAAGGELQSSSASPRPWHKDDVGCSA